MRRFYLFCNNGYGRKFRQAFRRFSKNHPEIECIVVLSGERSFYYPKNKPLRFLVKSVEKVLGRNIGDRVIYCDNVNAPEFIAGVPENSAGFVAGFNQIFDGPCISKFEPMINFHPSCLPFYRGAIPSYWVLKNGERRTGFTAHRLEIGIDKGTVLHQEHIDIPANIDEHDLDQLIAAAAAPYFYSMLTALISNQALDIVRLEPPYRIRAGYTPAKRDE